VIRRKPSCLSQALRIRGYISPVKSVCDYRSAALLDAIRVDDLQVINELKIFQYLGKTFEACGLAVAVPVSPLRTAFINFGREYPNQTFAKFIARAKESLTPVVRKRMLFLMPPLCLILTASNSHAGLGWTLAQFKQQYGEPVLNQEQIAGRIGYVFMGGDYITTAFFLNGQVSRILYICRSGSVFDWGRARALLGANARDAIWTDASKNEADHLYRVNGTKDGVETYYASLTDDWTTLVIWTKEDDEAGRTSPKPGTPPLSKVMGWNEKSTGEITAEQASSIESGLAPKITHPDLQANATSRRSNSVHAAHTKTAKVRHRSSMHPRYVDVKTRLIALWHQSLRHEKSRGGMLFSNSNKGARKKVDYTAETRH
jgi:hypothetical protein